MSSTCMFAVNKKTACLFAVTGLTLTFINLCLIYQNQKLKVIARNRDRHLELSAGAELPPIQGFDAEGNKLTYQIKQESQKTLLLVFAPGCHSCQENMPNWLALMERVNKKSHKIIAVSLSSKGIEDYVSKFKDFDVPVITEMDSKTRVAYNLMLTPQQILIGPDGKVERVWTGLLKGDEKSDFENALEVKLSASE